MTHHRAAKVRRDGITVPLYANTTSLHGTADKANDPLAKRVLSYAIANKIPLNAIAEQARIHYRTICDLVHERRKPTASTIESITAFLEAHRA